MEKIFLPLYRYFHSHKALMYAVMVVTFAVFLFFGLKVRYVEDIYALMPEADTESQLAFSSIGLKDKVYLQLAAREGEVTCEELGSLMDEFETALTEADSTTGYVANMLTRMEMETGLNALYFALDHLPSFVDTGAYRAFEAAMQPDAVRARMEENCATVMSDETGTATQMVAYDPLGLRDAIVGDMLGSVRSGYTIVDGHFFSADSTVALAWLAPSFPSADSHTATAFSRMLGECIAAFEAEHPEARVLAHGAPLAAVSNSHQVKADLLLTVGGSLLLILILIGVFFRSAAFLWKQLLPIAYGVAFSLACIWWIQGGMSLMALGISVVVLGVAISYCLHITIHHFFTGDPERMLRDESTPVVLGCLTTVGAFCSLLFTDSALLRDFGLFASLSLLGSTFYALVFLPHFLPRRRVSPDSKTFRSIVRLNNLPVDRKPWFLVLFSLVVAVGVALSPRVRFDSDLRNLNYKSPSYSEAENLFNAKNNDGYTHLYYASVSTELDEALEGAAKLMPTLASLKARGVVHSYNDMVPRLFVSTGEQQRRIDAWNAFWTSERKKEALSTVRRSAAAAGLDPAMFQDFEDLISADYEPESLVESGVVPEGLLSNFIENYADSLYLVFTNVSMNAADKDSVTEALVAMPGTLVLEPFYYCKSMVEVINDDFNVAVWISSLLVLLILLLSFRNIATALLSFLPMVLSWFMVQGYMALFGVEFNLINIVISTFIFGVGVDYSIFITEGLLAKARSGSDEMLSWHKVAIFFSAVILIIVVASLMFAIHPAIRSIGLSTLIGMVSTIMISYSLQPFLFRQLMRIPAYRRSVTKEKKKEE